MGKLDMDGICQWEKMESSVKLVGTVRPCRWRKASSDAPFSFFLARWWRGLFSLPTFPSFCFFLGCRRPLFSAHDFGCPRSPLFQGRREGEKAPFPWLHKSLKGRPARAVFPFPWSLFPTLSSLLFLVLYYIHHYHYLSPILISSYNITQSHHWLHHQRQIILLFLFYSFSSCYHFEFYLSRLLYICASPKHFPITIT